MSKLEIVRAWKDQDYRASLTEAQRAQLPAHPSGAIEVRCESDAVDLALGWKSPCHKCTSR